MSRLEALAAALSSADHGPFLDILDQHLTRPRASGLDEALASASVAELAALSDGLLAKVTAGLLGAQRAAEREESGADRIPDDEDDDETLYIELLLASASLASSLLAACASLASAPHAGGSSSRAAAPSPRPPALPPSLTSSIELLHDGALLRAAGIPALQKAVGCLCARFWSTGAAGRERAVAQTVPWALAEAAAPGASGAAVKRCCDLRGALELFDYSDVSSNDLVSLLGRCCMAPSFLKNAQGRRFVSRLFSLGPEVAAEAGAVLLAQLPRARPAAAEACGEILVGAWREGGAARLAVEEGCLPHLVDAALAAAADAAADGARRALGALFRRRGAPGVDETLARLCWRKLEAALAAGNHRVRARAYRLLADAFPIRGEVGAPEGDDGATGAPGAPGSEGGAAGSTAGSCACPAGTVAAAPLAPSSSPSPRAPASSLFSLSSTTSSDLPPDDLLIERQFAALRASLRDPNPTARAVAAGAAAKLLGGYWEIVPPGVAAGAVATIAGELVRDGASAAVRQAALAALADLLDAPAAAPVLARAARASAGFALLDPAPPVARAALDLLAAADATPGVGWHALADPADLMAAAARPEPGVAGRAAGLLLGTLFADPDSAPATLVALLKTAPAAGRAACLAAAGAARDRPGAPARARGARAAGDGEPGAAEPSRAKRRAASLLATAEGGAPSPSAAAMVPALALALARHLLATPVRGEEGGEGGAAKPGDGDEDGSGDDAVDAETPSSWLTLLAGLSDLAAGLGVASAAGVVAPHLARELGDALGPASLLGLLTRGEVVERLVEAEREAERERGSKGRVNGDPALAAPPETALELVSAAAAALPDGQAAETVRAWALERVLLPAARETGDGWKGSTEEAEATREKTAEPATALSTDGKRTKKSKALNERVAKSNADAAALPGPVAADAHGASSPSPPAPLFAEASLRRLRSLRAALRVAAGSPDTLKALMVECVGAVVRRAPRVRLAFAACPWCGAEEGEGGTPRPSGLCRLCAADVAARPLSSRGALRVADAALATPEASDVVATWALEAAADGAGGGEGASACDAGHGLSLLSALSSAAAEAALDELRSVEESIVDAASPAADGPPSPLPELALLAARLAVRLEAFGDDEADAPADRALVSAAAFEKELEAVLARAAPRVRAIEEPVGLASGALEAPPVPVSRALEALLATAAALSVVGADVAQLELRAGGAAAARSAALAATCLAVAEAGLRRGRETPGIKTEGDEAEDAGSASGDELGVENVGSSSNGKAEAGASDSPRPSSPVPSAPSPPSPSLPALLASLAPVAALASRHAATLARERLEGAPMASRALVRAAARGVPAAGDALEADVQAVLREAMAGSGEGEEEEDGKGRGDAGAVSSAFAWVDALAEIDGEPSADRSRVSASPPSSPGAEVDPSAIPLAPGAASRVLPLFGRCALARELSARLAEEAALAARDKAWTRCAAAARAAKELPTARAPWRGAAEACEAAGGDGAGPLGRALAELAGI